MGNIPILIVIRRANHVRGVHPGHVPVQVHAQSAPAIQTIIKQAHPHVVMWVRGIILQMVQQHVLRVRTSPKIRTIPARAAVQIHVAGHVMPDSINLGHRVCHVVRENGQLQVRPAVLLFLPDAMAPVPPARVQINVPQVHIPLGGLHRALTVRRVNMVQPQD